MPGDGASLGSAGLMSKGSNMQRNDLWSDPEAVVRAGLDVPPLTLASTVGPIDLRAFCAGRAVLYYYPATGVPGRDPAIDPAPGWDDISGAAGCTPQCLGFKQEFGNFERSSVRVAGISTQPLTEQRDFANRHELPFPLICDSALALQRAWGMPTFTVGSRTFLERLVMYVEACRVQLVIYPIAAPGASAQATLDLLSNRTR